MGIGIQRKSCEKASRQMDIFACAARKAEDAWGNGVLENLVVQWKAPKAVFTKAVLRQMEDYMDFVRKQPAFNSPHQKWKFIAVCGSVDEDVKARYGSQTSKGKKGLVADVDHYEIYALTWDDLFQSFALRHGFLLEKLQMERDAIAKAREESAGTDPSGKTADNLAPLASTCQ